MAATVFGNPITNTTLEGKAGIKDIQKIDRAGVLLKLKNSDGQDTILHHLSTLEQVVCNNFSDGIATYGRIQNGTGDTVQYITHHDWAGQNQLSHYPEVIADHLVGVFFHMGVKKTSPSGSVGAVVYRGKSPRGDDADFMLAWNNSGLSSSPNTAYTEINEIGYFDQENVWGEILKKLKKSGRTSKCQWKGCVSTVQIGDGEIPMFEAKLSI